MGRPKGSKNTVKGEPEVTVMGLEPIEDEEDYVEPEAPEPSQKEINKALVETMQAVVNSQPVKRVPWAKFKTKSSFNPTGNRKRKLDRRFYQNGNRVFVPVLHDEEIALLNQIEPGTYIKGMVKVFEQDNGTNTDLHIVYKTGKEHQLANSQEWRSLTEMLKRCVTEGPQEAPVRTRR